MKKILTVLTAVLLLCGMVFSMASCGSVNMDELKTQIEELAKNDENITASTAVGESETYSKTILKSYRVRMKVAEDEYEYLTITEYANTKLAKLAVKFDKLENNSEEESYELQKKYNELAVELGEKTEELEEPYETVLKRKGTVVISGSKAVYEKIF